MSWSLVIASVLACAPHEREGDLPDIAEKLEAPPTCEVALADDPVALLADTLTIRPPQGLEGLDDGNPMFTMLRGIGLTACGRTIRRMMVMAHAHDPSRSLHLHANDLLHALEQQGYVDGQSQQTFVDDPEHLQLARRYPAAGALPPVQLYLAFLRREDRVVTLVFELDDGDLDALRPSVEASLGTLGETARPPRG